MRSTQDVVGKPKLARKAECVSKYTSPGSPSTVMVESVVFRLVLYKRWPRNNRKPLAGLAACKRAGPASSAGQGLA
jgi:hypothetical protein